MEGPASGASKGGAGRALKVDWSVNIGEHVFAITVGRCSRGLRPSQVDVVVVGAYALVSWWGLIGHRLGCAVYETGCGDG